MIDELKEVFELATNCTSFVNELLKIKNTKNKLQQNNSGYYSKMANSGDYSEMVNSGYYSEMANSGYYSKMANSGYYSKMVNSGYYSEMANSGYYSKMVNSGDYSKMANSGYSSKMANSGYYSKMANSGYYSKMVNSGDYSKMANSGDYSEMANSGDSSKMANSGDSSKMANSGYSSKMANSGYSSKMANSGDHSKMVNSGDYSKMANSGDYSEMDSTGENSVIASIGLKDIVKAKKDSWITLAEYKQNENSNWIVDYVKTERVDGETIKENTYYTLYNHKFVEVQIIDNIKTIVLQRKTNVIKGLFLNDLQPCYVVEKDGVYAHGATLKEAKESLVYKIADRDKSDYENYTLDTEVTHEEAIKMYRVITGACEMGTRHFVENVLTKKKKKYTVKEIIKLTEGQYGNETLKKFMENK